VALTVTPQSVRAALLSGEQIDLNGEALRWAAAALAPKAPAALKIRPGSILRVVADGKGRWNLAQLPQVGSAWWP